MTTGEAAREILLGWDFDEYDEDEEHPSWMISTAEKIVRGASAAGEAGFNSPLATDAPRADAPSSAPMEVAVPPHEEDAMDEPSEALVEAGVHALAPATSVQFESPNATVDALSPAAAVDEAVQPEDDDDDLEGSATEALVDAVVEELEPPAQVVQPTLPMAGGAAADEAVVAVIEAELEPPSPMAGATEADTPVQLKVEAAAPPEEEDNEEADEMLDEEEEYEDDEEDDEEAPGKGRLLRQRTMPSASASSDQSMEGMRVSILFSDAWFTGRVGRLREDGRHHVHFDDGEEHCIQLKEQENKGRLRWLNNLRPRLAPPATKASVEVKQEKKAASGDVMSDEVQIAKYAANVLSGLEVVEFAEGLRLHLSSRSNSGYKGVFRDKYGGEYVAYIQKRRADNIFGPSPATNKQLGRYATAVEAAVAYAKHVGEAPSLNGSQAALKAKVKAADSEEEE